jgi:hypothetical protein
LNAGGIFNYLKLLPMARRNDYHCQLNSFY